MHIVTFLCLMFLAGTKICAQSAPGAHRWSAGVRSGITVPNLQAADEDAGTIDAGYKSILRLFAGAEVAYRHNASWETVLQVNFSGQGGQKNGNQKLKTAGFEELFPQPPGSSLPPFLYTRFDNRVLINYIEAPLMARFYFLRRSRLEVSAQAGLYAGYLIYARNNTVGTYKLYLDPEYTRLFFANDVIFDNSQNILDQLNRWNYGLQGGGRINYLLGPHWSLDLSGGGSYGLKRLQNDEKFGNNKTGALVFTVGTTYRW